MGIKRVRCGYGRAKKNNVKDRRKRYKRKCR
jgi:hypothetical protein